jgi:hypothetical protein
MIMAVIHDWLYNNVGSERVLESILRCFPIETIYALVDYLPENKMFYLNNVPVK